MILLLTSKQHATKLVNFLNAHETECGGYFITTDKSVPDYFLQNSTVGICYGYPWLITRDMMNMHPHITWYNFHPAPLSNEGKSYGDWGNYAIGLADLKSGKLEQWGVSLHLADEGIDSGHVLRVMNIPLMSIPDDIQELGDIGHYYMFQLFKQTIVALHRYKPQTKETLDKLC